MFRCFSIDTKFSFAERVPKRCSFDIEYFILSRSSQTLRQSPRSVYVSNGPLVTSSTDFSVWFVLLLISTITSNLKSRIYYQMPPNIELRVFYVP